MSDGKLDFQQFEAAAPAVVAALRSLSRVIAESGLETTLTELLKVRASQLNGCAFCLGMHLDIARRAGVSQQALDLIATWREAPVFTPRERAALEWTEALTLMARQPVPDEIYRRACAQFPAQELAFLTSAIALINAWNRIAGGLRFEPG
ncbi:MAG TPA: carboxymuconolactone decarboxylase family protein [Steroidobacteraceae bacterium]|nr:carboxymuconolactone decarboxylase family protein [Steroidobacteraceae bacterium]